MGQKVPPNGQPSAAGWRGGNGWIGNDLGQFPEPKIATVQPVGLQCSVRRHLRLCCILREAVFRFL